MVRANGWALICIALAATAVAGCKKEEAAAVAATPSPTPSPTPEYLPVGTVDDSKGMFVRSIEDPRYVYKSHEETSLTTKCEVTSGAADKDILCYVEAKELDLWFHGASLHYNFPTTMCSYAIIAPYWYYTREPGTGPTSLKYDIDTNGAVANLVATPDATTITWDGTTPKCNYDYSGIDGPNCCEGEVNLEVRTYNNTGDTPGYGEPVKSKQSWGGQVGNCIAGAAVDTQPKSSKGKPRDWIYFIEGVGLNDEYEIQSPEKKEKGHNLHVANYFLAADHAGGTSTPAAYPKAMRIPAKLTGGTAANAYYDFQCLDRALEIKARIRVMIREWNTASAFDAYVNDNVFGPETAPFDYSDYNDILDWKDYGNNFPLN